MEQANNRTVPFHTEDRQWDARFNVHTDEDLGELLANIRAEFDRGRLKYVLVSGVEVGTRPFQDDYLIRHVHVAAIFVNRISKRALLKSFGIKQGNGYYLVPRNRDLPYSGWRSHHIKEFSKVDPTKLIELELGTLTKDASEAKFVKRSEEEKKRKIDEVLIDMRGMIENEEEAEAFKKYPRTYLQYGEKIKALIVQKRDKLKSNGDPHIWLYGSPGIGKSAILNYVYPQYYKKNLYNRFFDLYDPNVHTHVMLEDLDHDAVDKLSTNFLKTLCDESGFPIDQKYKTPQLCRSAILVTSNFTIEAIITQSEECNVFGKENNKAALVRRFWQLDGKDFLRLLGLKMIPKYEVQQLKKQGNTDPGKLFMTWDYLNDLPACEPIGTPEEYQKKIRDLYYGASV